MPNKIQKSLPSFRTLRRRSSASFIKSFGFLSLIPYDRCSRSRRDCFSVKDGRCSECVLTGREGSCTAIIDPKAIKTLEEQEAILRQALEEAAAASAKAART